MIDYNPEVSAAYVVGILAITALAGLGIARLRDVYQKKPPKQELPKENPLEKTTAQIKLQH